MTTQSPRFNSLPKFISRLLRGASHHVTLGTARLRGDVLGMVIVSAFPRSGSTLLSDFMGKYYDLPVPRWYYSPLIFGCVVHTHSMPKPFKCPIYYIIRDGRDSYVSYFVKRNPQIRSLHDKITKQNLFLQFLSQEIKSPVGSKVGWGDHILAWRNANKHGLPVRFTRYENILNNREHEFRRLLNDSTNIDEQRLQHCIALTSYEVMQTSDRPQTTFYKGGAGAWREFFCTDSAALFDEYYGGVLLDEGYEQSRKWIDGV